MLIKNKKIKIINILALSVCAFFVWSNTFSVFAVTTSSGPRAKDSAVPSQKNTDGSVVITSEPGKVVKFNKEKGLSTEAVYETPDKPAVVEVEESVNDPRLKALDNQPYAKVVPNYVYKAAFTPNDPNFSAQWNLSKIAAPAAWDITRGNTGVTIAVIDTGILSSQTINGTTYSQPDFPESKIWNNAGETGQTQAGDTCWTGAARDKKSNDCDDDGNGLADDWRGWDFMGGYRGSSAVCPNYNDTARYESSDPGFVYQDNDPQPYSCDSPSSPSTLNKNHFNGVCSAWTSACYIGHGTMVASVAAATGNNGQLVAGLDYNAKIMDLRAIDGYGYTTTARIVAAINYAVDKGANVINMSLGSNCADNNFKDTATESALAAAASAGVVSVAASGNESMSSSICYPASSDYVVSVGATDQNDVRRSYSNYSNKLDVVAPAGVPVANAPSANINSNYYSNAGGTSLSTPHVAGLAALLRAKNPSYTRGQIINSILNGTNKVAGMGNNNYHNQYGWGRINAKLTLSGAAKRIAVYRLKKPNGTYFYTTSTNEKNNAVNRYKFRYEGVGFWGRSSSAAAKPVYRLFHKKKNLHFYTANINEKNNAVKKHGYRYEGIGFYVLNEGKPSTKDVFRLNKAGHFYTVRVNERSIAMKRLGYRSEGVGFRAE